MRRPLALFLLMLATPAVAQDDLSSVIAARGLRATEADLATRTTPTPSERFALGGVRFLAGIERALQLRYRVGLGTDMAEASGLPIFRLPIGENPRPEPFEPAMMESLFRDVGLDMAGALHALSEIGDSDAVAVEIRTEDLWFDINSDGARQPGEGVLEITGWTLSAGSDLSGLPSTTIRFDTADSAWLSAYAHLLSAVTEAVLALGPTDGIARVLEARATFDSLGRPKSGMDFTMEAQAGQWVDLAAMWIMAIEGQPDPVHTRSLRDHLLAVVRENRRFWSLVPREQDNEQEWIPNKNQTSATGLAFPPGTGARWLAVLRDGERVLQGELLIPYWRVGSQAGLNLAALLENPPEIDIAGVVQGATLIPYLQEGPLADGQSVRLFSELVQGDSPLYAVLLN